MVDSLLFQLSTVRGAYQLYRELWLIVFLA